MKCGIGPCWIEWSKEDIKTGVRKLKEFYKKISSHVDYNKEKEYTIALIDAVYYKTGYIREYCKAHCSIKQIEDRFIAFGERYSEPPYDYMFSVLYLESMGIGVEYSGELNGYEGVELEDFDFVIDVYKWRILPGENKEDR